MLKDGVEKYQTDKEHAAFMDSVQIFVSISVPLFINFVIRGIGGQASPLCAVFVLFLSSVTWMAVHIFIS